MSSDSNVNQLIGLTLTEALQEGDDRMVFKTADRSFLFYHSQSCCESVDIEFVSHAPAMLVGSPILAATEDIETGGDSWTRTTFEFTTEKGTLKVVWMGRSNGYYSESVSFVETTNGQPSW